MSYNSKILIIQQLRSSPKTRSFALYQKRASSMKEADFRDMFKKASKCVCTSTVVTSPDPLPPIPSTSAMKTSENTEENPDDPEQADDPLISCTA
jgi:hypothetical protein